MKKLTQCLALAGITVLCLGTSNVMAQGEGGGPGGGRGNFDPAQMQQRMLDRVKEQFGSTDDEWTAMQPLVQKVTELRMQQVGGMGRGMMGNRNRGGDQGGQGNRPRFGGEPSAEETALSQAVESNASKEDLKTKMEAFRKAKATKEAELKTAQENLKKVLTTKQEALALQMGLVN